MLLCPNRYIKLAVLAWAVLDQHDKPQYGSLSSSSTAAAASWCRLRWWPASMSVVSALDLVNRFALLDVYVYVM